MLSCAAAVSASFLQDLYEAVREQCPAGLWLRAEQMAKSGSVDGKVTRNDELEVRLLTKGGMASPRVMLTAKPAALGAVALNSGSVATTE